jgi:hypothetical protein
MLVRAPRAVENRLTIVEGRPQHIDDAIQGARLEFLQEVRILKGWYGSAEIALSLHGTNGSYFYDNQAEVDPASRQRMQEVDPCMTLYRHFREKRVLRRALGVSMPSDLLTNVSALQDLERTYNDIAARNQRRIAVAQRFRLPTENIIGDSSTLEDYLGTSSLGAMKDRERGRRWGANIMVGVPLGVGVSSEYIHADGLVFGKRAETGEQVSDEFFGVTRAMFRLAYGLETLPNPEFNALYRIYTDNGSDCHEAA